tara:strand:- start:2098 stop:2256 length:159 start_codon:yes stop_codon:yes gene_type:complete
MGLLRAILITCLCYMAVERLWKNEKNPLPKSKIQEYEKPMLLAAIFFIELLW